MKRLGIFLCVVLFFMALPIFAEDTVLIDFANLAADRDDGHNEATYIDFSDKAGPGFTENEKQYMKTSLEMKNWEVELAASARTVDNMRLSYALDADVKADAKQYAGEKVLGVRVHFIDEPYNSWAMVKPPFVIPSYEDRFNSFGVVKNVGVLKSISVNVLGKNCPNGFAIILVDENNKEHNIFMGYLDFEGWKTVIWENPEYVDDVRDRELKKDRLYPKSAPFMRLAGFVIYKSADQEGGDFVTYIKDVSLTYDKAVIDLESDVDDEKLWGILGDREEDRRNIEYRNLGNKQVLRFIERQLMHAEEESEARPAE